MVDKLEVGKRYLYDLKSRYEQDESLMLFYNAQKDNNMVVIMKEPVEFHGHVKFYWEKPRERDPERSFPLWKESFTTYDYKIMPYLTLLDNYIDLELLYN